MHLLMFFAESCDHMSRRIAKYVEKESLEGNSDAKNMIQGNAFIKTKIIEAQTLEGQNILDVTQNAKVEIFQSNCNFC